MLTKKERNAVMVPQKPKTAKPITSNGRLLSILGVFTLAFGVLIGRAVYLQTIKHDFLMEEAAKRFIRTVNLPASRGMITDRNGALLALNAPTESLYAIPSDMSVQPTKEQLQALSKLINVPVDTLQARLGQKKKGFVYLQRRLSEDVVKQVKALDIKGLAFQQESKRHYPTGELFAHVLGFVNIDNQGQEGLELSMNKQLEGQNGIKTVVRDRQGNIIDELNSPNNRMPQNGNNIILSLDQRIQTLAVSELEKAMAYHQAHAGSVVVLDARTGEVLALANSPTYNPNDPSKTEIANRRNRAVIDMIEPGSAMKPFPVAKGLDDGKINIHSVFNTNPYNIGPATVRDTHNYGSLNVEGIMQKSSNVGTSRISSRYSAEEMYHFYRSLGIGQRMHTGFPGETAGLLRPWKDWKPIEQATMSFGYGLQLSLLQLARAYTVLTTDGKLMPISFQKQEDMPEGEQIIKPSTAKSMRKIMISVTEPGGTGTAGAVDGFDVAAKTGTARKLVRVYGIDEKYLAETGIERKKVVRSYYASDKHMATFIGFAPAQNPRLIVAVNIDEPTVNGYYGGTVAGPVFKGVMTGSLNILGVPNTKPFKQTSSAVQTAQKKP